MAGSVGLERRVAATQAMASTGDTFSIDYGLAPAHPSRPRSTTPSSLASDGGDPPPVHHGRASRLRTHRHAVRTIFVALALLASACGSDAGTTGSAEAETGERSITLVDPGSFAERIDAPGVVTINVHTPDEGSIAGTDLTIPFDQIAASDQLPDDLSTPLAVYCRSGNMSADAVEDLEMLGYTDIVELEGGFNAWTDEGRPLIAPAAG